MNFDDYTNKLPYPKKSDYTTVYYYHLGKVVAKLKAEAPVPTHSVKESVTDMIAYQQAVHEYHCEDQRLVEKFKHDVCVDLQIVGHPKAELLLSKAWAMGHASGYSEVYNYACDLVDLIKD